MMMRRFQLSLLCLLLPALAFAQEPKTHPIDKALDACVEKNPSTAGMVTCLGEAYDKWDKELNRVYNELSRKLAAPGKQALKTAQLEWLKFRDAEFKLLESIYANFEGTMYIPMQADEKLQIVRKRTLDLQDHLDMLKEHSVR